MWRHKSLEMSLDKGLTLGCGQSIEGAWSSLDGFEDVDRHSCLSSVVFQGTGRLSSHGMGDQAHGLGDHLARLGTQENSRGCSDQIGHQGHRTLLEDTQHVDLVIAFTITRLFDQVARPRIGYTFDQTVLTCQQLCRLSQVIIFLFFGLHCFFVLVTVELVLVLLRVVSNDLLRLSKSLGVGRDGPSLLAKLSLCEHVNLGNVCFVIVVVLVKPLVQVVELM